MASRTEDRALASPQRVIAVGVQWRVAWAGLDGLDHEHLHATSQDALDHIADLQGHGVKPKSIRWQQEKVQAFAVPHFTTKR